MKVFISYPFDTDKRVLALIRQINDHLLRQRNIKTFFWEKEPDASAFQGQIGTALADSAAFILFLGSKENAPNCAIDAPLPLGNFQTQEVKAWIHTGKTKKAIVLLPPLRNAGRQQVLPGDCLLFESGIPRIEAEVGCAAACAKQLLRALGLPWNPTTGVPDNYLFDYEKAIIDEFQAGAGKMPRRFVEQGCTPEWPSVSVNPNLRGLKEKGTFATPRDWQDFLGNFRAENARVAVDARVQDSSASSLSAFALPEAGPRALLRFHPDGPSINVAILVSGGIAPGINAVISGIVDRHRAYEEGFQTRNRNHRVTVFAYEQGFSALFRDGETKRILTNEEVKRESTEAGSIVPTARADRLVEDDPVELSSIATRLRTEGIDILYVIGGDGSMRAAHALGNIIRDENLPTSIVGIPKTMDNDILWVWQAFGFLSAVERARESIVQLHTEVKSNPRLCVMQLFGSDSGFVVSHAVLGSGVVDLALIPEVPFSMDIVSKHICQRLKDRMDGSKDNQYPRTENRSPYALVVMAETAIPRDFERYLKDENVRLSDEESEAIKQFEKNGWRVRGQTPDALRTAGLKVVSRVLLTRIRALGGEYWSRFRVLTNEPRHLIRSMPPSVSDVIHARRLGMLAVDNALAGYTDFMVSQWLTEYVLVPFKLVVVGRKRVPQNGIFWKSTIAKTGQPAVLYEKDIAPYGIADKSTPSVDAQKVL